MLLRVFLATNKPFLLLAILGCATASALHGGALDREEGVHALLLALVLRLLQLLDVPVHALGVEALVVHQELLQSLAVDFREGDLHVLALDNLRVLEQLSRALVRPVLGHGELLGQVLQHLLDGSVLLNELVGLHLPDAADRVAVIATAQNAHVNELGVRGSLHTHLVLSQLHILQQSVQIHFENAALILLRAVLALREVTQQERRAEGETVHVLARHAPHDLLLHQLRTLRFGLTGRVDDGNAHQLKELLAVILAVIGERKRHDVG